MTTRTLNETASKGPPPEQLLAAYADGGLSEAECEAVERYLREHPDAGTELDDIRSLLDAVRVQAPTPAEEPDWVVMSVDITRACDRDDERTLSSKAGLWDRIRGFFGSLSRPRVAGLALAGAVAVALILALSLRTTAPSGGAVAVPERVIPDDVIPDDVIPDGDIVVDNGFASAFDEAFDEALGEAFGDAFALGDADLEQLDALTALDGEALASLYEALDPSLVDVDASTEEDELDIGSDHVLSDDLVAEWTGADDDGLYGTGFGLDVFAEPDYEDWLDGISDADLDTLDTLLQEMLPS